MSKPSGAQLSHLALHSSALLTEEMSSLYSLRNVPCASNQGLTGSWTKHESFLLLSTSPLATTPPGSTETQDFHFTAAHRDLETAAGQ